MYFKHYITVSRSSKFRGEHSATLVDVDKCDLDCLNVDSTENVQYFNVLCKAVVVESIDPENVLACQENIYTVIFSLLQGRSFEDASKR